MVTAVADYFRTLGRAFAEGWNRFWFTPVDPYPLGVIRLLTGLIACWLQLALLPDVARFFASGGWIPLELVEQTTLRGYPLSYFNFFQSANSLFAVHCLGLAVLAAFTVGFWTRLSSILALAVMLSNVHRAPMITTQVEPVVTMVMFYLCLGPAGTAWSVDRLLARRSATAAAGLSAWAIDPPTSFSAGLSLRLIQVHLAMLYATMGAASLLGDVWWNGTGVWWLATRPESRLVDLTGMHQYLTNFWTHAIVGFELGFPILIWVRLARPLLLGIAVVIWLSVALLTAQVTFALMMLVANLSFCSPTRLRSCAQCCCQRKMAPAKTQIST